MPERRRTLAAAGAVLVLAAVAAVVLVFGYVPLPDFPSLAARPEPDIPGSVAYLVYEEREGPCLETVPASGGEPRRVTCRESDLLLEGPGPLAWTPEGDLLLVGYQPFGGKVAVVLDPETGDELERIELRHDHSDPLPSDRAERADRSRIVTRHPDDAPVVAVREADGTVREVLRVEEAPRDYAFWGAQWSPDGEWILLEDSEGRLIVVAADGAPGPRLLVGKGSSPAWYVPGETAFTVDPDSLDQGS